MSESNSKAEIKSIDELLQMNLQIPDYQRPYKWSRKNVSELLGDIETAIAERRIYGKEFKYRVGTVILHRDKNEEKYNVVDGQQRLITLSLIKYSMDSSFPNRLLEQNFKNNVAIERIRSNYSLIKERLNADAELKSAMNKAFSDTLEAVVLEVDKQAEAFQLFDSQNTRGKELYPQDLLKAYHLRAMDDYPFEKLRIVRDWEQIPPKEIQKLFSVYLYPILRWSQKEHYVDFTADEIDLYKGVPLDSRYTYGQRASKASPYFQINEPFCAGGDFFKMTKHYIDMLTDIREEIENNLNFEKIKDILKANLRSSKDDEEVYSLTGFRYAVDLFYCALLFYYDRFHSFNVMAIKKLFLWAMMIRVDMQNLGMHTINKYALGESNTSYMNQIPMFYKIAQARKERDVVDLDMKFEYKADENSKDWRAKLCNALQDLLGGKA